MAESLNVFKKNGSEEKIFLFRFDVSKNVFALVTNRITIKKLLLFSIKFNIELQSSKARKDFYKL